MIENLSEKYKINKGFLSSGRNLKLENNVIIKHPSIEEILNLDEGLDGIEHYWQFSEVLRCDPYDNMVILDDMGINYLDVDCFDVFVHKWQNNIKEYEKNIEYWDTYKIHPNNYIRIALMFFLGSHNFDLLEINLTNEKQLCLVDLNSIHDGKVEYYINRETFNYIANFISAINNIPKTDRINPANETTRQMLIDEMRDEQKRNLRKQKQGLNNYTISDYVGDAIDVLSWAGNGSINIFEINKLKIYQLLSGYNIIMKKDNYNHVMNGVYFGTVDIKKVNQKELDWKN